MGQLPDINIQSAATKLKRLNKLSTNVHTGAYGEVSDLGIPAMAVIACAYDNAGNHMAIPYTSNGTNIGVVIQDLNGNNMPNIDTNITVYYWNYADAYTD